MATQLDLHIEQGATFAWSATLMNQATDGTRTAVDLTGYTARMQIRRRMSDDTPLLSLTTENGRIILGGSAGSIFLEIAATDTAGLSAGKALYDLELVNGSMVKRLIEGLCVISAGMTR